MNKMQILMILGAGVVSFTGSFGLSWFLKSKEPPVNGESLIGPKTVQAGSAESGGQESNTISDLFPETANETVMGMSEKQLQHLIHELRSKIQEYRQKEKELADEDERLDMARQTLAQDIDRLNELRGKLVFSLQELQQKEQSLNASLVTVETIEKENFQRLAGTYDKMDSAQASRILLTMSSGPQIADAVKILYYMTDRPAANVLAEIANTRPEMSAVLSLQLKRVQEKD